MNKTNTSDEVLQLLLDHLNIVEESREMLLKEYFTEETEESKKLQRFFREYVTTLKNYVQNSKVTTKVSKIHPGVFCYVHVFYFAPWKNQCFQAKISDILTCFL